PWGAATCLAQVAEIADAAAYAANAAKATAADFAAAAAAAAYAANAVHTVHAVLAANYAASAANAARAAAAAAADALAADAAALEGGMTAKDLATQPLWPDPGMPEDLAGMWSEMSAHLRDESEGWEVWTDWYEARLAGGKVNEDLEVARVLVDPALWKKSPAEINAHMATLIEQAENGALPTAAQTARTYRALYMKKDEADEEPNPDLANQIAEIHARLDALDIDETKIAGIRTELARFEELRAEIGKLDAEAERMQVSISAEEKRLQDARTEIKELAEKLEKAHEDAATERDQIIEGLEKAGDNLLNQILAGAENKAPAKLWATKAKQHWWRQTAAYVLFVGGLGAIASSIVLGFNEVLKSPGFLDDFFSIPTASGGAPTLGFTPKGVMFTAGVLTLFTLALWFTRLQMKVYLAERHLAQDARERIAFSQTYMVMLEGDKYATEQMEGLTPDQREQMIKDAQAQKQLVYAALFRPTSDGIVKEETGLDPSISAAISKLLAGK
ncbi:MAG: hypothetical protein AAGI70_06380, partial [Pseudomonadota bacterium]